MVNTVETTKKTSGTTEGPSLSDRQPLALILPFKLQALVHDILPSTTAVYSYAIDPRKLSANEQFFVGAQTVVRLLL